MERDELKEQALKLSKEKDTLNSALVEAQGAALGRAGQLSEANNSIKDLKPLQKEDTSVTFWAERNFFLSYI